VKAIPRTLRITSNILIIVAGKADGLMQIPRKAVDFAASTTTFRPTGPEICDLEDFLLWRVLLLQA
jgi:hypothetical protein